MKSALPLPLSACASASASASASGPPWSLACAFCSLQAVTYLHLHPHLHLHRITIRIVQPHSLQTLRIPTAEFHVFHVFHVIPSFLAAMAELCLNLLPKMGMVELLVDCSTGRDSFGKTKGRRENANGLTTHTRPMGHGMGQRLMAGKMNKLILYHCSLTLG